MKHFNKCFFILPDLFAYACSIVDKKHTQITTDCKKLWSLNALLIAL